jgi:hypothetical protein
MVPPVGFVPLLPLIPPPAGPPVEVTPAVPLKPPPPLAPPLPWACPLAPPVAEGDLNPELLQPPRSTTIDSAAPKNQRVAEPVACNRDPFLENARAVFAIPSVGYLKRRTAGVIHLSLRCFFLTCANAVRLVGRQIAGSAVQKSVI